MHWLLSSALYFDQFWAKVVSAVRSSSMQASLSRPAEMANWDAALQVVVTSSLGGASASATATCSPSNSGAAAILLNVDIMLFPDNCRHHGKGRSSKAQGCHSYLLRLWWQPERPRNAQTLSGSLGLWSFALSRDGDNC